MRQTAQRDSRPAPFALMIRTPDEPGALHALTQVIFDHRANITYVDIAERREGDSTVYFELEDVASGAVDTLIGDLEKLQGTPARRPFAPRTIPTVFHHQHTFAAFWVERFQYVRIY